MWIWQDPIKKIRRQNADEKKPETPSMFQVFCGPAHRESPDQELNRKFITSPSFTT
jgi:hypothetical protein